MTILLPDITDITIYDLRNKLIRLRDNEFNRVIFMDDKYALTLTKDKALLEYIPRWNVGNEVSRISYNLNKDMMLAFAGISQMIYKLADQRYPNGRK